MNKIIQNTNNTNFTNFLIGLLIGLLLGTVLLAHEYKVQVKELKALVTVQQGK